MTSSNSSNSSLLSLKSDANDIINNRTSVKTEINNLYTLRNLLYENLLTAEIANYYTDYSRNFFSAYINSRSINEAVSSSDVETLFSDTDIAFTDGIDTSAIDFHSLGKQYRMLFNSLKEIFQYPSAKIGSSYTVTGIENSVYVLDNSKELKGAITFTSSETIYDIATLQDQYLEDGTEEYPYLIKSFNDFEKITEHSLTETSEGTTVTVYNNYNGVAGGVSDDGLTNATYYKLVADIVIPESFSYNDTYFFAKEIDGNGHSLTLSSGIKNIHINSILKNINIIYTSTKINESSNYNIYPVSASSISSNNNVAIYFFFTQINIGETYTKNIKIDTTSLPLIYTYYINQLKNLPTIVYKNSSDTELTDIYTALSLPSKVSSYSGCKIFTKGSKLEPSTITNSSVENEDGSRDFKITYVYNITDNNSISHEFTFIWLDIIAARYSSSSYYNSDTSVNSYLDILASLAYMAHLESDNSPTKINYMTQKNILKLGLSLISENVKTLENTELKSISAAVNSFQYIESQRASNDSIYDTTYTLNLLNLLQSFFNSISYLLNEADLDASLDEITSYTNDASEYILSAKNEIENIFAGIIPSIISIEDKVGEFCVFFESDAEYSSLFSDMLAIASNELESKNLSLGYSFLNIPYCRNYKKYWLPRMQQYSYSGDYDLGELYLGQELGMNLLGRSIDASDSDLFYMKKLVNNSLLRMYKRNIYNNSETGLKFKSSDILDYEKILYEKYGIKVSSDALKENLPSTITNAIPELSALNNYDYSSILFTINSDKNTSIKKAIDVALLKYLFKVNITANIVNTANSINTILETSERTFKSLLVSYQLRNILHKMDVMQDSAIYIDIASEEKVNFAKELVSKYLSVWIFKFYTNFSSSASLIEDISQDATKEFLYGDSTANYTTDGTILIGTVAEKESTIMSMISNLWNNVVDFFGGIF